MIDALKDRLLIIRLSEHDAKQLTELAKAKQQSKSAVVRTLVAREVQRQSRSTATERSKSR